MSTSESFTVGLFRKEEEEELLLTAYRLNRSWQLPPNVEFHTHVEGRTVKPHPIGPRVEPERVVVITSTITFGHCPLKIVRKGHFASGFFRLTGIGELFLAETDPWVEHPSERILVEGDLQLPLLQDDLFNQMEKQATRYSAVERVLEYVREQQLRAVA